ncbi:glycosidase, partial [bacterium]|nr:glycosidase [bacterium]
MNPIRQTGSPSDLKVRQLPIRLERNVERVVTLPFHLGVAAQVADVFHRIAALSDEQVARALESVIENFAQRHEDYEQRLEDNYALASRIVQIDGGLSLERKLLIGAYFTLEYSIEAAALFNPSIVPHPDQAGVPPGGQYFVMSLRAVGEGHLSSTVFRTGLITAKTGIALDPLGTLSTQTRIKPDHHYLKPLFLRKLEEMAVHMKAARSILGRVEEEFTYEEMERAIEQTKEAEPRLKNMQDTIGAMVWLARANYELRLDADDVIGDLIMFPRS